MHYLIVISVAGKSKAVEELLDQIENVAIEATMQGGIDGLTTEVIKGAGADAARERIRSAASDKKPRRKAQ